MIEKVKYAMLCMARQCWEQGAAAQAMLECGDVPALLLLARDCVVRQRADGRLCDVENTPASVDPACCVEPVLAAGRILGDESYAEAARRNIDYLRHTAPRAEDGALYHMLGDEEIWADGLAMGPHVLMAAGYLDEGYRYYQAIRRRLLDPETGLFRHKWHEGRQCFTRPCFWGVGNGWALVGLMRMTKALMDAGDPRADALAADYRALVDAMRPLQAENGLFHDMLDDEHTFYESETAEMFAYTLYNMVSWKKLDASYLADADRAREAVNRRLTPDGLLTGSAGSPLFETEGTSVEAQAHWIMMDTAARALGRP